MDGGVALEEVKRSNKITVELRRLILPQPHAKASSSQNAASPKKLKLAFAKS